MFSALFCLLVIVGESLAAAGKINGKGKHTVQDVYGPYSNTAREIEHISNYEANLLREVEVERTRNEEHSKSIKQLQEQLLDQKLRIEEEKELNKNQQSLIKNLKDNVQKQKSENEVTKTDLKGVKQKVTNLSALVAKLYETKKKEMEAEKVLLVQSNSLEAIEQMSDQAEERETNKLESTDEKQKQEIIGEKIPEVPRDCADVYARGLHYSGIHTIKTTLSDRSFPVFCEMVNGTAWTTIQRRIDGSVEFYRGWNEYKNGFGDVDTEFWLGLDNIYALTNQGQYMLRIDMSDWEGNHFHAEYDSFRLDPPADKFALHVSGFHGNAGDSLTSYWENHDGQPFSTYDQDNDNRYYDNCAEHFHGAWWFNSCFESHLNGVYYHKGSHDNYFVRNGIQWNTIHLHSSLKTVSMKIRPTDDNISNAVVSGPGGGGGRGSGGGSSRGGSSGGGRENGGNGFEPPIHVNRRR